MPTHIAFTPAAPLGPFDRVLERLGAFLDGLAVTNARRGAVEPFGL